MYKYISSTVITKQLKPKIAEVDTSNISMLDLYNETIKTYVIAKDTLRNKEVILDLDTIKDKYINSILKVKDVLNNETYISTVDKIPTEVKLAKYRDVYASGYKVNVANMSYDYDASYPQDLLPDLVITRPSYSTDMSLLHTQCLLSLNGYLRPTDASKYKNRAYVKNGGIAMRYSNTNTLGILGFHDIGNISKYTLTKDDIIRNSNELEYHNTIYIKTKEDISNKSILLSLAGYMLHEHPGILFKHSSNLICLKLNKLHLVEKYFECRPYVDLSSLELDISDNNQDMISLNEFLKDDVITKLLTLDESFLITIDNPDIVYNKLQLSPSNIPGRYTCWCDPGLPMFMGYGRMVNYWVTHEDDHRWNISTNPTGYTNYHFHTTTNYYKKNIDNSRVSTNTYDKEHPYFLQIISLK